mgnify:FL=1
MKNSSKERTLQWIKNQNKKGNISFSHRLQRPINQWNTRMKSLLIHSLLSGIPVNPIYVVEEDNIIYPLDGSQRTSTCLAYLNDEFSLSKDTPNVFISVKENGEQIIKEYEIAGKKFKKLDEEVKETLLACTLEFCTLSDYTDEDIKTMFARQNSGKPLGAKLLRVVHESDEFGDVVYSLAHHPLMDKVMSPTQRKNGTDKDTIVQTFMLIATNQGNDFTSFRAKDIDAFVTDYADQYLDKADTLKEAMDRLNESFDKIKIPVTSLPQILYAGYRVTKDKKSFSRLADKVADFVANYDSNEEYKQFVQSGTGSKENVNGRFQYWRGIVKTLQ